MGPYGYPQWDTMLWLAGGLHGAKKSCRSSADLS